MKLLVLMLAMLSVAPSYARQYIQCSTSDNWDRAVVNLDGDQSTLFMTNGVHLPPDEEIRVLKDLAPAGGDDFYAVFKTEGEVVDTVKVPLEVLGKYASGFEVLFSHKKVGSDYEYERVMYCFSAIYEN